MLERVDNIIELLRGAPSPSAHSSKESTELYYGIRIESLKASILEAIQGISCQIAELSPAAHCSSGDLSSVINSPTMLSVSLSARIDLWR